MDVQVVLRRAGAVLTLSLIFAVLGTPGLGAVAAPGWIEFDRWCDEVVGDDAGSAFGIIRVYQAKQPADDVRDWLPERLRDVVRWRRLGRFLVWEPVSDVRRSRDLVVVAPEGEDDELTA